MATAKQTLNLDSNWLLWNFDAALFPEVDSASAGIPNSGKFRSAFILVMCLLAGLLPPFRDEFAKKLNCSPADL